MSNGRITESGVPAVPISIAGVEFEAIIDTGFEGGLQLPMNLFGLLNPIPHRQLVYELGTGQIATVVTYLIRFHLNHIEIQAEALFAPSPEILLGIDVIKDCQLEIDFPGGKVGLFRVR